MKIISLLLCLISLSASAQVIEMGTDEYQDHYVYAEKIAGTDWLGDYQEASKTVVLLSPQNGTPHAVASFKLKFGFHGIDGGMYVLRFKSANHPLFLFLLRHDTPETTVYILDPTKKAPTKILSYPTDLEDFAIQEDKFSITYSDASGEKTLTWDYKN